MPIYELHKKTLNFSSRLFFAKPHLASAAGSMTRDRGRAAGYIRSNLVAIPCTSGVMLPLRSESQPRAGHAVHDTIVVQQVVKEADLNSRNLLLQSGVTHTL